MKVGIDTVGNAHHVAIISKGVKIWNQWRREHPHIRPDLSRTDLKAANLIRASLAETNLSSANLDHADLAYADFSEADLTRASFIWADLSHSSLSRAKVIEANLNHTNLSHTNLEDINLMHADLSRSSLHNASLKNADLSGANLFDADLTYADLTNAELKGTNLSRALIGWTIFANNDLSVVNGLDAAVHRGPSTVGVDTLYKSSGNIPDAFLEGCGLPDEFVTYLPSLVGVQQAIQFYSCFISYSHKDEEFAKRLYSRMRDAHLRVWFAPEDIRGGQKLHEQIDRAIQMHDRLLLVLSKNSLQSEWVMTEIRKARKIESKENRRKLFPIRLTDMQTIREWECFDADAGKDLAVEVREYFIPDFSTWKIHDSFEAAFDKLLRDLKAEELKQSRA